MSKAQKIEALLKQGLRPSEVSKRLKVSRQYVYGINAKIKKRQTATETQPVVKKVTFWQRIVKWVKGE